MLLSIIIHIYFAINIFIAGMEYQLHSDKKFSINDIFYYQLLILFASLFYIGVVLWFTVIAIYKRTWLNWGISTLLAWNTHIRKGRDTKMYGKELLALRKNVMINKMPDFMRKVWFRIIDENLQKQRDELARNGEVSDF